MVQLDFTTCMSQSGRPLSAPEDVPPDEDDHANEFQGRSGVTLVMQKDRFDTDDGTSLWASGLDQRVAGSERLLHWRQRDSA